jgi:UPF0716 protein FxsA
MRGFNMRYLLLPIIIIPAIEISLLLLSGKTIGVLPTVFLILLTGVVGAYLAKKQGIATLKKAQEEMRHGSMPADAVLDGICILIGGTLLLTPGFVTDLLGFLMLVPQTRMFFKRILYRLFKNWMNRGTITVIR